jgi:hypothetical protein
MRVIASRMTACAAPKRPAFQRIRPCSDASTPAAEGTIARIDAAPSPLDERERPLVRFRQAAGLGGAEEDGRLVQPESLEDLGATRSLDAIGQRQRLFPPRERDGSPRGCPMRPGAP